MVYGERNVDLKENMVVKNYKEMCNIMGEDIKGGDSKKAQINNWKRYFDFAKEGQKFIILEVYDEPFPSPEIRRRKEGLYIQYIECLLMDILANNSSENKDYIISKCRLFNKLGMVNDKYIEYYNNKKALVGVINKIDAMRNINECEIRNADELDGCVAIARNTEITEFDVKQYYTATGYKLNSILDSALKSMSKRNLISYVKTHMIIMATNNSDDNKSNKSGRKNCYDYCPDNENLYESSERRSRFTLYDGQHLADNEEEQIILTIKREALTNIGCYNLDEVIRRNLINDYNKEIDCITVEKKPEWKFFFPVFHFIHCDDLKEQIPLQAEEVRRLSFMEQKEELNKRVCSTLKDGNQKRYDKNLKEYNEYIKGDDEWGTPNPMERKPFLYPQNYVSHLNRMVNFGNKI